MAGQDQKLRVLYVMDILQERTDEEHILNASDLAEILKKERGMECDRKTIYSAVETLKEYGMDIIQVKGKVSGYYVGSRHFELAELKLLVDAVQSSKFITSRKTKELIAKLEKLTSTSEAEQLQRQVYIYNRTKTDNETIYYSVDMIHDAIYNDKKIRFQYAEWKAGKKLELKHNGAFYEVSPWALSWDDENYYLIAFDEKQGIIKHYRVDKIRHLEIMDMKRCGEDSFRNFDLAVFAKKTFGMYGGTDITVTLHCRNNLAGVIIDRFGSDVWMVPDGEDYFHTRITVTVSRQFFGWLTGIGNGMKIVEPAEVRREYREYLRQILDGYQDET